MTDFEVCLLQKKTHKFIQSAEQWECNMEKRDL